MYGYHHQWGNWGFQPVCGRLVSDIVADKDREITELKAANETAQRRLAAKQAVVERVCKERDKALADLKYADQNTNSYREQNTKLHCEVAKLKGDLAQKESPEYIRKIAEGNYTGYVLVGTPADAVRKLRADYEYEKKRADDFVSAVGRSGPLLAAIRQVAEGGPCVWDGPPSATLDAVKKLASARDFLAGCLDSALTQLSKARGALA